MNDELTQTLINVVIKQRNENASRCAELEAKLIIANNQLDTYKNKEQAEELFDNVSTINFDIGHEINSSIVNVLPV